MIEGEPAKALIVLTALTAGVVLLCTAGSNTQLRGYITKAGVYALTDSERKILERGSPTGYVTEGGRTFQSVATNVALVKGTSFGYDFRIEGAPDGRPVRFTHLITHPKMTKPDGTVLAKQTFDRDITGTNGTISGRLWYTLREDFELLPGNWTLSVLHGTSVLVEKKFTVVLAPSPAPVGETATIALNQVHLYVPIKDVPERVGDDAVPLADYIKALQKAAAKCIGSSEQPKAKGLLVAVGIKAGKKSRIWCQAVDGSMSRDLLLNLEMELSRVEPIALDNRPMAFGLELRLRGEKIETFPDFPEVWVEAAKKTKSKLLIPPDELFQSIWPD